MPCHDFGFLIEEACQELPKNLSLKVPKLPFLSGSLIEIACFTILKSLVYELCKSPSLLRLHVLCEWLHAVLYLVGRHLLL